VLKTILNRPVAVVTVFSVIVAISILMVVGIPLDLYPSLEFPLMAITVPYPGAGPEEVEEEVTRVIEGEIAGMEGLTIFTSTSNENMAQIILEFEFGTDVAGIEADIRSRLDRVKPRLPALAEDPILVKFDPASFPILTLSFNGDRSERDLAQIARDRAIPALEAMEGVGSVNLVGIRESIVQVDIDQAALESYGLSLSTVSRILSAQNFQLGAGSFVESDKDILIRTSGRFQSLDEIGDTVITTIPGAFGESGTPIFLKDMGNVSWGYADSDNLVRINGEPGISLELRKGSDSNSVEVADAVKAKVAELNREMPAGVTLAMLTDSTSDVRDNLSQVSSAAGLGILFAVMVLLLFLRQVKSTLIAGLSIPIALVITMAGLAASGRTLNLITLVGLAMGVGLIVDSSIVIIENIFRLRMKGAPMGVSARRGAGEMMAPITASTLTTIAVFLPLLIYKKDLGFIGNFFGELAFVIILALLSALAVAAILVPVLSSHFLTIHTREERPIKRRFLRAVDNAFEGFFVGLENAFAGFLTVCMKHKIWVIFSLIALIAGSLLLSTKLDVSMMPPIPEHSVIMEVDFPIGTALRETERVMMSINERFGDNISENDTVVITASKSSGSMEITIGDDVSATAEIYRIKGVLRTYFDDYPGLTFRFISSAPGSDILKSSGVDVKITGSDLNAVQKSADEIEALMKEIGGITEVNNDTGRGLPEVEIIFNRRALYEQGLNAVSVAAEIRALTAGIIATVYIEEGESYDIVLRLAEADRSDVNALERLFVTNPAGERVSVAQIAEIRRRSGPLSIFREDQMRAVHVVGTLAEGASVKGVTAEVQNFLTENVTALPGAEWSVSGELDDFQETASTMVLVMVIATLLVIAVMVAQFESFKDPLVIVLAMPMMIIGLIALFIITETTISMVSMMGIIMLLGIVVNNGIVLVDHTRLMRRRGMGVEEACVESGRTRLRPVLMTTLTTILAMTPMAFFAGEGGQMMQPMGVAVVGGLSTSMIGTLVLVPTFYAIAHRREKDDFTTRRERWRMRKSEAAEAACIAAGEDSL